MTSVSSPVCTLIVTFNAVPWIRRNLDALRASTLPSHVLVVDNASADDTVAIIEREYPEVELIRMPSNLGFGSGNNAGISRALDLGFEFMFLLNQDAFVAPPAIAQMADFLAAHDEFALVSPLHCGPDFDTIDARTGSFYLQPYARGFLSDACLGRTRPYYAIHGVNAAAWFVRGSVFRTVGGFDPLFFMYGEDDDLLNRLEWHRQRFALLPGAQVVHVRGSANPPTPGTRLSTANRAMRARSALLVDIKHPNYTLAHMALRLIAKGVLQPLADYLIDRDGRSLRGHVRAAFGLLKQLGQVRDHAALCARAGAHFLSSSLPANRAGTATATTAPPVSALM